MQDELTISAMMGALNSDDKPRLVLARGGFSLTLDPEEQAKLADAIATVGEKQAELNEPSPEKENDPPPEEDRENMGIDPI